MPHDEMHAQRERLPTPQRLAAAFERCGVGSEELRQCVLACRRSARRVLDAELCRVLATRGHDTQALCARELTAKLGDITLFDLLQMISMGRKDAVIDIQNGALVSRVWCSGGEIMDAVSGHLKGEAAAYRILALDAGELLADFRPVERPRVIESATQELMLEALRRKDECAVLLLRLGGVRRVYSSVAGALALPGVNHLESALLEAFRLPTSIDAVLAGSARADLETLQTVSALVDRGCLVAQDEGPERTRAPAEVSAVTQTRTLEAAFRGKRRSMPWAALGFARHARLWAALGVCAGLGIGSALLWPAVAEPRAAEQSTGKLSVTPSASSARAGQSRESHVYPVVVAVQPARADLWLDGARIATGDFSLVLARDGRVHELRIEAPGHVPQTLLFRDVPPPRAVVLERAPAPDR